MAWTDPRTWTDGEVITASIMNTHVRDNVGSMRRLVAITVDAPVGGRSSSPGSAFADVDAALAVTFTVPISGNVLVVLQGSVETGTSLAFVIWNLREGSTNLSGTERTVHGGGTATGNKCRRTVDIPITGLSAGTSKTYKWGHKNPNNVGATMDWDNYNDNSSGGPALMEVWQIP